MLQLHFFFLFWPQRQPPTTLLCTCSWTLLVHYEHDNCFNEVNPAWPAASSCACCIHSCSSNTSGLAQPVSSALGLLHTPVGLLPKKKKLLEKKRGVAKRLLLASSSLSRHPESSLCVSKSPSYLWWSWAASSWRSRWKSSAAAHRRTPGGCGRPGARACLRGHKHEGRG